MTISSFIASIAFMYFVYLFISISRLSNDDYDRHRELLLDPENDNLGDTTTSMYMGKDGKVIFKKRASIGATKRLLNKEDI